MPEPQSPLNELGEVATQVAARARDAVYTAVGLGVLGLQRAQVRRRDLARHSPSLDEPVDKVRALLAEGFDQVDQWLETTLQLVESSVRPLESQLPPQARDLADKAFAGVRELSTQLRQRVVPGD